MALKYGWMDRYTSISVNGKGALQSKTTKKQSKLEADCITWENNEGNCSA